MTSLLSAPSAAPRVVADNGYNLDNNPYSQVGRVTYTAEIEHAPVTERLRMGPEGCYYGNTGVEPRTFDVDKPDLMLQKSGEVQMYASGGTLSHMTKVFGVMNALRMDQTLMRWQLISKLRFAGAAQSQVKFLEDSPSPNNLSMTVGGTHSVMNNGFEHIMAGDEVYWDIPDVAIGPNGERIATGFYLRKTDPKGRIPAAVVRPYRSDVHGGVSLAMLNEIVKNPIAGPDYFTDPAKASASPVSLLFDALARFAAMSQVIGEEGTAAERVENASARAASPEFRAAVLQMFVDPKAAGYSGFAAKDFSNIFVEMMNAFAENMNHVSSRKFGKALTNGSPGHNFDILFGVYRC